MKFIKMCCLLLSLTSCFVQAAVPESRSVTYLPYLELSGIRHFKDHFSWSYGGDIWLPVLQQSNHLLFSTLNFTKYTGESRDIGATLGYRFRHPKDEKLLGIYTGFDLGRDTFGDTQKQLSFGVEWWQNNLFLGANYYLPYAKNYFGEVREENTITKRFRKNMKGSDVTIGCEVVKGISLFVTGYHFYGSDLADKNVLGGRTLLRLEYWPQTGFINKISLETGVGYDKIRKTTVSVGVKLGIGAAKEESKLSMIERHMTDMVLRSHEVRVQQWEEKEIKEGFSSGRWKDNSDQQYNKQSDSSQNQRRSRSKTKQEDTVQNTLKQCGINLPITDCGELLRSYKNFRLKYHPDRCGNDECKEIYGNCQNLYAQLSGRMHCPKKIQFYSNN